MATPAKSVKFAFLQLNVVKDRMKNVEHALEVIRKTVKEHNPRVVVLPECFNCPYDTKYFAEYSEPIPAGPTCQALSKIAKELNIYLIGGSIIEVDEKKKYYNSCPIWDPKGNLIGRHRKIHLFDINLERRKFKESDVLTPGKDMTMVEIEGRKIGIGVCHDVRFEELARLYRKEGCDMLIYPCAFDVIQGPMHWTLHHRARANDNQVYVAMISTARDETASYVAYGHTMIVDPWTNIVAEASEKEEILVTDIDFTKVEDVRRQMPIFSQRRTDLYDTVKK